VAHVLPPGRRRRGGVGHRRRDGAPAPSGVGQERTLSQLRADSLAGIVTGRLLPAGRLAAESRSLPVTERDPAPSADGEVCTCGGRAPAVRQVVRVTPTRPTVRITVPATTLLGVDDAPGELAGFGPVP